MKRFFISTLIILYTIHAIGQDYEMPFGVIQLDSFTVTAVKGGLDIADLIDIMQFDSTLYIAFNNLHFTDYTYNSDATAYAKDKSIAAWRKQEVRQQYDGNCRQQYIDSDSSEGHFINRKGKENYYTLELFNRTFYTDKKICGEQPKTNWNEVIRSTKKEGHVSAIKKVIFNPGTEVNLPLIGKKFALFDQDMMPYYDYAIRVKNINGQECYEFSITVKDEYASTRKAVIVRELVTAFRMDDLQIIRRNYRLKYAGGIVKVDIKMDILLQPFNNAFYPYSFNYNGFWKVPTKKLEDLKLLTVFDIS